MTNSSIFVLILTPKASFLALNRGDRLTLLSNLASPVQEFTGSGGGVFFSERVSFGDGSWILILAAQALDSNVITAFMAALRRPETEENFTVTGAIGDQLGIRSAEDGPAVMRRIIEPFLD